jgi:hypothetical protein
VATAQQEFDEGLADVLDGMADRMEDKTLVERNGFESSVTDACCSSRSPFEKSARNTAQWPEYLEHLAS